MAAPVIKVVKNSPQYWRATFDAPPHNFFGEAQFTELTALIDDLEKDEKVKVIVFDSSAEDFFIAHFDLVGGLTNPDLAASLPSLVHRLASLPIVTIAEVRGRTRGFGNELIGACDMRFASREKAIFGQLEIGCGTLPGGGGLEWLTRLVGRSRALEISLGGDDYDASTAELWGWINRAIPDEKLSSFVDGYAKRIASFDNIPLREAKKIINARAPVPKLEEFTESMQKCGACLQEPEVQGRMQKLFELGLHQEGETERNLGKVLGELTI